MKMCEIFKFCVFACIFWSCLEVVNCITSEAYKAINDNEIEYNGKELFYNAGQSHKKKFKDVSSKLENSILKSKVEALGKILKKQVYELRTADSKQIELVFLVDSSASVGAENFESELKFVRKLLADFTVSENATRVSVIAYSSPDNVVRHIDHISSSRTNHKCSLLHHELPSIKYTGGGTYTRGALLEAKAVLQHGRSASQHALFLITDGFSNGGDPLPIAQELKERGVTIFTFGIRNGNTKELCDMASQPGEEYSYILDSFGEFEALVRRALHQDLKVGRYLPIGNNTLCNSLCSAKSNCCDDLASCSCGTNSGHFACLCRAGYYGSGLTNSCKACPNGTYSLGLVPGDVNVCIPCPDLNHITNIPATSLQDCHCKKGFVSSGDHCKVITCPKLSAPLKGFFVKKSCSNVLNAACGVKCQVGYQLTGSSIRLCQDNGTWSGEEANCIVKTCPQPKIPKNGSVTCSSKEHIIDTECEFSCRPGHILVGSRYRSCLPLARWDGLHTTCKPLFCPPLTEIHNGMVTPNNCLVGKQVYGTKCNISCNAGYQLKGPKSRVCGPIGKWTQRDVNTCIDVIPPSIQCPNDIVMESEPGEDFATVNWTVPIATDNDGLAPTMWTRPVTKQPMKVKIGNMTITYIAIDAAKHKAKCNFTITVQDLEPPTIDRCESPPPFLLDAGDSGNLTWDPPLFHDNSGLPVKVSLSQDRNTFPYGTSEVVYTATDIHGNNATCIINITVEENVCQVPLDPINGHVNCTSNVNSLHCTLTCEEGYAFAVQPRDYFCTYDSDGSVLAPDNNIDPFPDCSLSVLPNSISQDGTIIIEGDGTVCEDVTFLNQFQSHVREKITEQLAEICRDDLSCNVEDMDTLCEKLLSDLEEEHNTIIARRKRQSLKQNKVKMSNTSNTSDNTAMMIVENEHRNQSVVMMDAVYKKHSTGISHRNSAGKNMRKRIQLHFQMIGRTKFVQNQTNAQNLRNCIHRVKEALRSSAKKGSLLNLELMQHQRRQLKLKQIHFKNEPKLICSPGSVLKGKSCVKCPVGTYWNINSSSCESCPIGQYQHIEGSITCLSCPQGTSTRKIHAKNVRDCRSLCPPGFLGQKRKHWKSSIPGLTPCSTCDFGSYQPKPGQTECRHCPGNWTTLKRGSTSFKDCKAPCPPGEVSELGVEPCFKCPIGYSQPSLGQKYCDSDYGDLIDVECISYPCQNGGTCHSLGSGSGYFVCDCPPGFLGSYCEIQMRECVSSPCLHGATCIDTGPSQYSCLCMPGYSGQKCEVDIEECDSDPCWNGATCVDSINDFSCLCSDGFEGLFCEKNIDDCSVMPCLHNGTCIDGIAKYSCQCLEGYSGRLCEVEPIHPCASNPCYNEATCSVVAFNYSCECPVGYEGINCEINTDDCTKDSCFNNGICIDMVAGYNCSCQELYSGEHCETQLPSEYFLHFSSSGTTDYVLVEGPHSPLTQVSVCLWLKATDSFNYGTVFSYATNVSDNSFTLTDYSGFVLYVNGERIVTDIKANDGFWHSLCVMWHSLHGDWSIYIDGNLGDNGTGLANGTIIPGNGILILGQEQDLLGSGFNEAEAFLGYLSNVAIWDYMLEVTEVWNFTILCESSSKAGSLFVWTDFLNGIHGDLKIENSSFCGECLAPSAPYHGKVEVLLNSNIGAGSIALYTCNPGFSLRWGGAERTSVERKCLKQGDWEGPTPYCIRKSCGFPGYFPRGVIRGRSYRYTDTIHYICNPGYRQIGTHTRLCMANGKWSGEAPVCEGKTCEAPKTPDNGKVRSLLLDSVDTQWNNTVTLQYGHQVEIECDLGFKLKGVNVLTCLEDGNWDEIVPTCHAIGCINPPKISHGININSHQNMVITNTTHNEEMKRKFIETTKMEVYDIGIKLIYKCETGYVFQQPVENNELTYTCEENGVWKGQVSNCVIVKCPELPLLEHGEIISEEDVIDNVTKILNKKNVESHVLHNENSYIYGSKIYIHCETGYKLNGPSVRQCLESGIWSLVEPKCERITCELSEIPLYIDGIHKHNDSASKEIEYGELNITGNFYNDTAVFTCNTGYRFTVPMLNSSLLTWTCDKNGSWILSNIDGNGINVVNAALKNGQTLCESFGNECPAPKEPNNGYILRDELSENFTIGRIVKFKCRLGYLLQGSDTAICQSNGYWSHDNTACAPVQCQNPVAPIHTELATIADEYLYGNMLTYRCKEGYQQYGILTSRCLANGKWSRVRGKCTRISCGKPPISDNATIIGASYLYQDQVVYNCPTGTRVSSNPVITCLSDGTWSGSPSCEKL